MKNPLKNSKLFNSKYSHLWYLLIWVSHFILFYFTEKYIPNESCYPVHSPLDDIIPFCEYFIIPYVLWYLLIIGTVLYLMLYSVQNFKNLMIYILVLQVVATLIFVLFPNRQDLRPTEFANQNLFTDITAYIYKIDTNTNVCPSLHVAISIGIASAWIKEKSASTLVKVLLVAFCISVCLSVVFVKQHSIVDFYVAIPICMLAEYIAFKNYRKTKKLNKQ